MSGAEGGPGKRAGHKASTARRSDPYFTAWSSQRPGSDSTVFIDPFQPSLAFAHDHRIETGVPVAGSLDLGRPDSR